MSFFSRDRHRELWPIIQSLRELSADDAKRCLGASHAENMLDSWAKSWGLKESRGNVSIARIIHVSRERPRRSLPSFPPANDHASLWLWKGLPAVYVSQPYGWLDLRTLTECIDFCELYGLELKVDVEPAWHFPGSVLMMMYAQPSWWEAQMVIRSKAREVRDASANPMPF